MLTSREYRVHEDGSWGYWSGYENDKPSDSHIQNMIWDSQLDGQVRTIEAVKLLKSIVPTGNRTNHDKYKHEVQLIDHETGEKVLISKYERLQKEKTTND